MKESVLAIVVIINKDVRENSERYGALLKDNGFEVRIEEDSRFIFGNVTDQEIIDRLQGVSGIIVGTNPYSANVIDNLPELRVIARTGVGYDSVDISAATENKTVVTITPNANYEAVAEHAMMLILAIAKSIVNVDKGMRLREWPNSPKKPIRGSVLGIVGLGRIGKSLAIKAKAMKMKVVAAESIPDKAFVEEHDIDLITPEQLFKIADYISLHCPLTDETQGIINHRSIDLMKAGVSIINTARGGLVVESDLVAALESGKVANAGLDVFEQEPMLEDNPLYGLENVILSPHVAGIDELSRLDMGMEAANCIIDLSNDRWPDGAVVNGELKEKWCWGDDTKTL